ISTMNVDWPCTRLSDAPTRVKMRSATGSLAASAGTNEPICASNWMSPTCRSSVLLPAMFGPVRIMMRASSSSTTSFGMNSSRGKRDEPDLPQQGAFAGHGGAGEENDGRVLVEHGVGRDELLGPHHRLDHGGPPAADLEPVARVHLGPDVASPLRDVRERGQH